MRSFTMKSYLLFCVIFGMAFNYVNANCTGDCPDTEDIVWALGSTCNVFRNECYFIKANCVRKPGLTMTTKEECQKKCPDICPAIYSPTTGNYKGQIRYFSNECQKRAHTCRTGETFL